MHGDGGVVAGGGERVTVVAGVRRRGVGCSGFIVEMGEA